MSIKLLENNFKVPCYAGPPSSPLFRTHTTTVWIHRTTWWIIPASTNLGIKILENNFKIACYARVSPLLVYLHPQFLHIWHIWSPHVKCSASLNIPDCGHATWWKIHLNPHVYKNFSFISLSTPPFFAYLPYLVARCKTVRLVENTTPCGGNPSQTCNLMEYPPQTPCL